jgi:hypothetical protein
MFERFNIDGRIEGVGKHPAGPFEIAVVVEKVA